MKKCGKCQIEKDESEFCKNGARYDGLDSRCKMCKKENRGPKSHSTKLAERRWNYANSDKLKEYNRRHEAKTKYGITLEEYKEFMSTSSVCQICESTENLCYDHCHDSMEFRGVLCRSCNAGLGQLGDSLINIEKAYIYMKNHYTKNIL